MKIIFIRLICELRIFFVQKSMSNSKKKPIFSQWRDKKSDRDSSEEEGLAQEIEAVENNIFEESDQELLKAYRKFNINKHKESEEYNISTDQWTQMFEVAVQTELNQQAQVFETKIRELSEQINGLRLPPWRCMNKSR